MFRPGRFSLRGPLRVARSGAVSQAVLSTNVTTTRRKGKLTVRSKIYGAGDPAPRFRHSNRLVLMPIEYCSP